MEEMTDIAQMKWFKEFDTTNDKKALIAKVRTVPWGSLNRAGMCRQPNTPALFRAPARLGIGLL